MVAFLLFSYTYSIFWGESILKNSKPILTKFSLYNKNCKNIESTIFDLISGNKETKQTKGLAYILSKDVNLIKSITNIPQVKHQIDNALGKI